MDAAQLKRAAICGLCGKPFGHTGLPLFWRVSAERFGVDAQQVRRHSGMEMFLGRPALAEVFSDGAPLAKPVMPKVECTVCEDCANRLPIAMLMEVRS